MRGYLEIKSFAADAFLATLRIFHSACNFDIVKLDDKILPESEQNLKFFKQITEHFWQEIVKFYKFKPHLNFSYQILLPHKTKAVKSFAKSILKRQKLLAFLQEKPNFTY